MKKHRWAVAFTACLLAFTTYISLDTFVLSNAYQTNATEINLSSIKPGAEAEAVPEAETGTETDEAKQVPKTDEAVSEADPEGNTTAGSESSHHKKKPGSGSGGPGSGSDGSGSGSDESGSGSGGPGSRSGRHGSGHGGPGGGKGMGGSSASTTTIRNFDEEEAEASAAEVTTDNSGSSQDYQDDNIKSTYTQYTTNDTTIHVADVQLSSAEYLKTAFANDTYGKNVTQTTSDIAAANKAILAINGDYYGVQEKGYVIRNGVLYRDQAGENDVLCIYGDGSMKIADPSAVTAQELLDQGVWQAFSFGPGLVADGQIPISLDTEVGRAKASNPRTAIGIIYDLHYVFVVSDGRSDESEGLSLYELATFMQELGVKTAYNLDGGGSSTMYFNGDVVNNPSSGFRDDERKVSDIIYIG
jgi:exopolysaccharide biosynthesis protein